MVTKKAEVNAKEITLEASQKIVLKVGPSFITLEPSGITIYGPQVKINSGGYASGVPAKTMEDPIDAYPSDDGSPGTLRRLRTATGGGGGGRGHNKRYIGGQHYRFPPRPGEDARFTATRNRLNDSEAGRHALEVMERYGTTVRYDTSDGYYYTPSADTTNGNTITMNPNYPQGFQDTGLCARVESRPDRSRGPFAEHQHGKPPRLYRPRVAGRGARRRIGQPGAARDGSSRPQHVGVAIAEPAIL